MVAGSAAAILGSRQSRRSHGIAPRPLAADAFRLLAWTVSAVGLVAIVNSYTTPRTGAARGIPLPLLFWGLVVALVWLVARATRFGRYVYAVGGNPEAARRAGVDVRRVTLGVFVWMGVLSALGGVLTSARLGAGANSMGTLAELHVIAAAVIGGTSLAGGRGSVPGAILGALVMQSLDNGMVLLGVSSAVRQIGIGLVLIVAVWVDVAATRRRTRS